MARLIGVELGGHLYASDVIETPPLIDFEYDVSKPPISCPALTAPDTAPLRRLPLRSYASNLNLPALGEYTEPASLYSDEGINAFIRRARMRIQDIRRQDIRERLRDITMDDTI